MNFPDSLERHRQSFLEAMKIRHYSPASIDHRGHSLDVFFRYLAGLGLDDLKEVSRQTIRDYQASLQPHYQIASVNAHMMSVRRLFEHLEKTDVVLVNPCAGVPLPKRTAPPAQSGADAVPRPAPSSIGPTRRRQWASGTRPSWKCFTARGIRLEEMTRLTVHDVDYRNGFVRVNRGKGGKERVVPMGRKACDYVREYLQKVRAEWSKENRDERALWLSYFAPHGPLKRQMIAVMVRDYGRAIGLKKSASPHIWRHTCATHMVSNGGNIAYVQRLLGHRSLHTTQIYTRTTITELRAAHAKAHPQERRRNGQQARPFEPAIGKTGQKLLFRRPAHDHPAHDPQPPATDEHATLNP